MDALLSISEASKKLGVSIGTLREWEREGQITPERTPGKHRRYSESSINNFIKQKEFIGKKIKLIKTPSWRDQLSLKIFVRPDIGDTGKIVDYIPKGYDKENDQSYPELFMIEWLNCKNELNINKKSTVEHGDFE